MPFINEIEKPTACIATFSNLPGAMPIYYEVVIDPRMKSPSGKMIRMDSARGCEVHGWQPIDCINIVEVLKEWDSFQDFDSEIPNGS